MGLEETRSSNTTYLSIVGGRLVKRITQEEYNKGKDNGEEGLSERKLTKGPNEGDSVYEKQYRGLSGFVSSAKVESSDYGQQVILELIDDITYKVNIPLDSGYANDLMFKWPSVDLDMQLYISPWKFEDDEGKNRMGMTLKQDGTKIDRYWTKDNPGELPQATKKKVGKETKWDFTDQQNYLIEFFENKAKDIKSFEGETSYKDEIVAKSKEAEEVDDELGF